jgi:hypothetical protein
MEPVERSRREWTRLNLWSGVSKHENKSGQNTMCTMIVLQSTWDEKLRCVDVLERLKRATRCELKYLHLGSVCFLTSNANSIMPPPPTTAQHALPVV